MGRLVQGDYCGFGDSQDELTHERFRAHEGFVNIFTESESTRLESIEDKVQILRYAVLTVECYMV